MLLLRLLRRLLLRRASRAESLDRYTKYLESVVNSAESDYDEVSELLNRYKNLHEANRVSQRTPRRAFLRVAELPSANRGHCVRSVCECSHRRTIIDAMGWLFPITAPHLTRTCTAKWTTTCG